MLFKNIEYSKNGKKEADQIRSQDFWKDRLKRVDCLRVRGMMLIRGLISMAVSLLLGR